MEKASKENCYLYNPQLASWASENRKAMPKSACVLWKYVLKRKRLRGYSFKRERPILSYIADFVCFELMLIIEVDGATHHDKNQISRDEMKDGDLQLIGFTVLRINALDILNNLEQVSIDLNNWVDEHEMIIE